MKTCDTHGTPLNGNDNCFLCQHPEETPRSAGASRGAGELTAQLLRAPEAARKVFGKMYGIDLSDSALAAKAPQGVPTRERAPKTGWLQKIFAEASKRVEDWPAWKKKIETRAVRRFSVLHGREYGRSAPCDIFDVWFDNRFPDGFGVDKTYLREAFEAGQMSARYYYFGDK